MKIHLDSPAEEVRIELVPLIDVIFCILTFFILATLQITRQQAIKVDLPKASTGEGQAREMMLVSLLNGQIYIDQQPVTRDRLLKEVKQYRDTNAKGITVLYASKEARYNDVVQVLDLMRSAGGDRVALATLPSSLDVKSPSLSPLVPFNPSFPNLPLPSNPSSGTPTPLPTFDPSKLQLPPAPSLPAAPDANSGNLPTKPAPIAPDLGVSAPAGDAN